jgi:hypothetical protein
MISPKFNQNIFIYLPVIRDIDCKNGGIPLYFGAEF